MSRQYNQGPKMVHPEQPSAVGSRNSMNRDNRDEYTEARMVVDEEVDKILNHIHEKLPPEVLTELDVMGNVKSHLHTYFNQSFQNMVNRYLVTAEDELGKKIRDKLDKEENKLLNRYTPREVAELVDQVGGAEKFNTGEVEKSMVNIMGHLQGHVGRGAAEFEAATTHILMQRADVGGIIRGENAYSVIKASFRDNYEKPDKVMDVTVSINVRDLEMISPIVPYSMATEHLVKEIIAKHIFNLVEREVREINDQLAVEGRESLSENEAFFEKIKAVESYVDDDESDGSKRYQFISRQFLDRIKGLGAEVSQMEMEDSDTARLVVKLLEKENLHNRGWSTVVNSLTSILDNTRMGYQHIDNSKDTRHVEIREYEVTDISRLPDERYTINMAHYTPPQIIEEQAAYTAQMKEFRREVIRLWNVVESIYLEEKQRQKIKDWDDLLSQTASKSGGKHSWFQSGPGSSKNWNEITFIQRKLTSLEEMNQTYERVVEEYQERFRIIRRRLNEIFQFDYPDHRIVVEQRLNFMESTFMQFMSKVNPYHLQPGLLVQINITSIKRNRTTVKGIANVLNDFLSMVSKGYTGASVDISHRHANVEDAMGAFGQSKAEG